MCCWIEQKSKPNSQWLGKSKTNEYFRRRMQKLMCCVLLRNHETIRCPVCEKHVKNPRIEREYSTHTTVLAITKQNQPKTKKNPNVATKLKAIFASCIPEIIDLIGTRPKYGGTLKNERGRRWDFTTNQNKNLPCFSALTYLLSVALIFQTTHLSFTFPSLSVLCPLGSSSRFSALFPILCSTF